MSDGSLLLDTDQGLLSPYPGAVLELFSYDQWPTSIQLPQELFVGNCTALISLGDDLSHPLNAYDLSYYYCRTGIRVKLDDPDPVELFAEVSAQQRPVVSIRIVPLICGVPALATHAVVTRIVPAPAAGVRCVAAGFVHPAGGDAYIVVDGTKTPWPTRVYLTITSGDYIRSGLIVVLP